VVLRNLIKIPESKLVPCGILPRFEYVFHYSTFVIVSRWSRCNIPSFCLCLKPWVLRQLDCRYDGHSIWENVIVIQNTENIKFSTICSKTFPQSYRLCTDFPYFVNRSWRCNRVLKTNFVITLPDIAILPNFEPYGLSLYSLYILFGFAKTSCRIPDA
jgi:hypothetical protein